jgi:hypothetical protein
MRNHRRRLLPALAVLAIAALATLFAFVSGSSAQASAVSANGHGALDNGAEADRQFSFSARANEDGTATGNAVLVNPAFTGDNGAPYQLQIDISCMHVVGNIAIFGGTTQRTNDANLVDAVFFTVQDNGEPGAGVDKISRAFFWDDDPDTTGDPAACLLTGALDFPLETIESGNIQVRG